MLVNLWYDTCPIPSLFLLALTFCRAILHDPVIYSDPDAFKPERFIDANGSLREDPVLTSLFGFGKRICPGRHLADAMFFIVVASFLSVFDIKKGNGTDQVTDGEPDMYPFTGSGVRCAGGVSLVVRERLGERLGELIFDFFLAFRSLSPTPSSQEIEGQKSLSLVIPRQDELLRI